MHGCYRLHWIEFPVDGANMPEKLLAAEIYASMRRLHAVVPVVCILGALLAGLAVAPARNG